MHICTIRIQICKNKDINELWRTEELDTFDLWFEVNVCIVPEKLLIVWNCVLNNKFMLNSNNSFKKILI